MLSALKPRRESEAKRAEILANLPKELPLDAVLTNDQIAALTGTSTRTVDRQIAAGKFPPRVRLSERRYGVRVRDYLAYLEKMKETR
jgi:predicted DNA-binding transcriptional regulator AlpA